MAHTTAISAKMVKLMILQLELECWTSKNKIKRSCSLGDSPAFALYSACLGSLQNSKQSLCPPVRTARCLAPNPYSSEQYHEEESLPNVFIVINGHRCFERTY